MENVPGLQKVIEALDCILQDINVHNDTAITILSNERYKELLCFLDEHYYPDELVYKTFNVRINQELEHQLRESFKQNISLIAIDKTSNKIIGALTSEIAIKGSFLDSTVIQDSNLRESKRFECFGLDQINVFERYDVSEMVYFNIVSVDRTMRKKGLGKLLVQIALNLYKRLGFKAALVSCSSIPSKKIFEVFNFEFLFAKVYDKWLINGRAPFTDTGEDKSEDFYGTFL